MSAAPRFRLLWGPIALLLACFAPHTTTAFTYTLYNDSACTQPLPLATYSNPALLYQPTTACVNVSGVGAYPTAMSATYNCAPVEFDGSTLVDFGLHFYSSANCSGDSRLLGGVEVVTIGTQYGVKPGSCAWLVQLHDDGVHTSVWGNVSVGAVASTNSARATATAAHHLTTGWLLLLTALLLMKALH